MMKMNRATWVKENERPDEVMVRRTRSVRRAVLRAAGGSSRT